MKCQISKSYNKISDVFSRNQIKHAVEGLNTYKQRIKLIDHIIDRREQIEKSEDIAKLQQYAHIFKKMLNKYKKKKSDQQQEQKQQRLEMVMQLLSGEKNKKPQIKKESRAVLRYCQIGNKLHQIINKSVTTQSTKADDTKIQEYSQPKSRKISRFFTEKDPMQAESQIEREVCVFLEKNKELNYLQKERFLRLTNDNKKFRYLENQIKQQLKQQEYQQQQTAVKQYYKVQNLFHKNYYKGASIKIIKSQKTQPLQIETDYCYTERQRFQEPESFASYTELKLNQLYTDSIDIQKSLKSKNQSCPNSLLQTYLINTNADIIDVCNQKLFQTKKQQK
ncbi:unnamed protein product [Paramecium primaurelia]|uniref:Uncharacterized protein n=1 Tax=Paramecium primaurelia TaxID=5886 RepID=A0A8S1Q4C7_PARPR|nr:unnamed protein product [Paramecium primaurelia]